jgi:hypothetical protein
MYYYSCAMRVYDCIRLRFGLGGYAKVLAGSVGISEWDPQDERTGFCREKSNMRGRLCAQEPITSLPDDYCTFESFHGEKLRRTFER